ncbi:MAG: hypothetical protein ACKOX6_00825 [Bdellovibrio sp.]
METRHTIWYARKRDNFVDKVECNTDVADMLWDRLEKSGHTMLNTRPNYTPKRTYGGLKDGSKAWPKPDAPITQADLDKWIPE